jgi:hypothetical protein
MKLYVKAGDQREIFKAIDAFEQIIIDEKFGIKPNKAEIEAVLDRLAVLWIDAFGEQKADRMFRAMFQQVGASIETWVLK